MWACKKIANRILSTNEFLINLIRKQSDKLTLITQKKHKLFEQQRALCNCIHYYAFNVVRKFVFPPTIKWFCYCFLREHSKPSNLHMHKKNTAFFGTRQKRNPSKNKTIIKPLFCNMQNFSNVLCIILRTISRP